MELRSPAGRALSESAQRVLAALRVQYAEGGAQRRRTALRRVEQDDHCSTGAMSSGVGGQRGAGRNGRGSHPSDGPFSLQGPPEGEGAIRGLGVAPERGRGATELRGSQCDSSRMEGTQASGPWEQELCRGARRKALTLGPLSAPEQRQCGRLLRVPWSCVSTEKSQTERGTEGAGSEAGLSLLEGQGRDCGGGAWPAAGSDLQGPNDSARERVEELWFKRPLESHSATEDEGRAPCRAGVHFGLGPALALGGVALSSGGEAVLTEMDCARSPAGRFAAAGESLTDEDRMCLYRETGPQQEQTGGYREQRAGGYREGQVGGDREQFEMETPSGNPIVCLLDPLCVKDSQEWPSTLSQVRETNPGSSSEASSVSRAAMESSVQPSRPVRETPTSRRQTPPVPSITSLSRPQQSPSLPRPRAAVSHSVLLKRRRTSPLPRSSACNRPGRWEPPRPSQERSGGMIWSPRPPGPSPDVQTPEGGHSPPRKQRLPLGGGVRLPKPLREEQGSRSGRGQDKRSREDWGELNWALTSDPAVPEAGRLSREERALLLAEVGCAPCLVLTMVYRDGSTQLSPPQRCCSSVSGLLILLKRGPALTEQGDRPGPQEDRIIYLRLEQRPAWAQQDRDPDLSLFYREMVLWLVSPADQLRICYKAKELLRTLLQLSTGDLSWKQVAQCRILDPQIAAWLLDPADSSSCFQDLVNKHRGTSSKPSLQPIGPNQASNLSTSLSLLYRLMMSLRSSLQARGLWELFSSVEVRMIPVLAAMESHRIHVDGEALKRTSDLLGASNLSTSLSLLYRLMMSLRSSLQARGLWELFSSVEVRMIPVLAAMESHRIHVDGEALKRTSDLLGARGLWELFSSVEVRMIPVLAAMESHRIHVDGEALKRTSDLLGAKLKQLEQEAHKAAGQQFLVSSSAQLRLVLFEKLRLQDRCENRKLPKTLKRQQSTSEAALLLLQDTHPLPKIILEYRQVHKIKSAFVDGILSCMKKTFITSTWNQTSTVSGRLSAQQPNFQALPRQPVQISKKQLVLGRPEDIVTVHPRDMFISQEGHTFLSADFCQVELRLLAHLTSDPELLQLFQDPDGDVFTTLASQWKGVSEDQLTPMDREHAKRIVYSVIYGAGRERLSGILGVSPEQASRFVDSFLQRYREVQHFIQRTIQQCQRQGYVVSMMGRRRSLPHIHSSDWALRNQAERQAVNFVVQGSAADLCKVAMIRISSLVSSCSSLTPRLLAQIHDELLFEVEDSQLGDFAALVKSTMESLQHIDSLGVHLKVPLKVGVSSGRLWGSMSELHLPPPPSL